MNFLHDLTLIWASKNKSDYSWHVLWSNIFKAKKIYILNKILTKQTNHVIKYIPTQRDLIKIYSGVGP